MLSLAGEDMDDTITQEVIGIRNTTFFEVAELDNVDLLMHCHHLCVKSTKLGRSVMPTSLTTLGS